MDKVLTQSATNGQLKQITRVGTDAVEKTIAEFGLDKEGAQYVHMHGDKITCAIKKAVIASLKDLIKDKEITKSYGKVNSGPELRKSL